MLVELAEAYKNTETGAEIEALLDPCVQCGQCTFTCPTFRLLNDEWDGPRGRIFLIKQFFEGQEPTLNLLPPAYTLATLKGRPLAQNLQLHLDRCLTCRSCETSCPKGVRYGRMLDIAREEVEKTAPRPWRERVLRQLVRSVVASRRRFTVLLRLGQALRRFVPADVRPDIPLPRDAGVWPSRAHARTMVVWQGCVQPALAPDINAAAARVLDRFSIRLVPSGDGCCGALSQHTAAPEQARAAMRKTIDVLWPQIENGAEAIVLTASGCGTHFLDYGQLLQDDPHYAAKAKRISELTKDIAEVVAEEWDKGTLPEIPKPEKPRRIAFQSSCSLQHGEKLNDVVEKLLKRTGFKLVPVSYRFMCCGAAGSFSILQRTLSKALRAEKLKTLLSSRPESIATTNIGCLIHLSATSPVPVNHWIAMLDETLTSAGM